MQGYESGASPNAMGRGLDVDGQETERSRQRLVSGDQPIYMVDANKGKRDLGSCGLDCLKQQEEPGVAQIRNAAPKTGACGCLVQYVL